MYNIKVKSKGFKSTNSVENVVRSFFDNDNPFLYPISVQDVLALRHYLGELHLLMKANLKPSEVFNTQNVGHITRELEFLTNAIKEQVVGMEKVFYGTGVRKRQAWPYENTIISENPDIPM